MNWIQRLYETYGFAEKSEDLLPIYHLTNNAQLEIIIDDNGNFRSARVVDSRDAVTLIPVTEKSGSRAGSKPVNHPLCDKLQYISGDFADFQGMVTSGYKSDPGEPFELFIKDLRSWSESSSTHWKVRAILNYVSKKSVMADLVSHKILETGDDGMLLAEPADADQYPIAKLLKGTLTQSDVFARWIVEAPGRETEYPDTWRDESLWKSWIDYYASVLLEGPRTGLCFVTGESVPLAEQHPAKIRNRGVKAKLISGNDSSGFTFRGRFVEARQVCGVGAEVSQQAHSALRWLIKRQGYRDVDLSIVAWRPASSDPSVPDPLQNTLDFFGQEVADTYSTPKSDYGQTYAVQLRKKTAGFHAVLGSAGNIVVMAVDSAGPGRMAIIFFRELKGSDYLERLESWHESMAWQQEYGKNRRFIGAPSPKDIAEACYGRRLDDRLRQTTIKRLLPCIIDGQALPLDLVETCFHQACRRAAMDQWEWNKILAIACSLYRKYHSERSYSMSLETERSSREYLYGRLLAVADVLEGRALWIADERRQTTVARLLQRFADHPYATWKTIELALAPYKARLGAGAFRFEKLFDEIMGLFAASDFTSNKSLDGEFLLGYHCQRAALYEKQEKETDELAEPVTTE